MIYATIATVTACFIAVLFVWQKLFFRKEKEVTTHELIDLYALVKSHSEKIIEIEGKIGSLYLDKITSGDSAKRLK